MEVEVSQDEQTSEPVESLHVEELWIALYALINVVEDLRTQLADIEGRIEDHNQRASHKI